MMDQDIRYNLNMDEVFYYDVVELDKRSFHIEAVTINTEETERFTADVTASAPMQAKLLFMNQMKKSNQLISEQDYIFDSITMLNHN